MSDVTEVRPKVFADVDGEEWRSVDGVLQVRVQDDDATDEARVLILEPSFGVGYHMTQEQWLAFLRSGSKECIPCVDAALANPMTAEEAAADDEAIA